MVYYHKLIVGIGGTEFVMAVKTEHFESLKDAILDVIEKGVDEIYFAGTCHEDDLEFFGNDCVEFEEDEFFNMDKPEDEEIH